MANFCSRCGAPSTGGNFCSQCGSPLVDVGESSNGFDLETNNPYAVGAQSTSETYDAYVSPTAPEIPTNVVRAFVVCMKKYCSFKGRASRSEYWYFILAMYLLSFFAGLLCQVVVLATGGGLVEEASTSLTIVTWGLTLALALPSLSVFVRRFHDRNIGTATPIAFWCLFNAIALTKNGMLGEELQVGLAQLSAGEPNAASVISAVVMAFVAIFAFVVVVGKGKPEPNRFGEAPVRRRK